jgi:methyltransferase-like protein
MADQGSVFSHSPNIVTRKTGNEYILVPVANNIADMNSVYTLNETGAFIWEQFDGKRSLKEIIDSLVEEYDVDYDSASKDVAEFVDNMTKYLIINE